MIGEISQLIDFKRLEIFPQLAKAFLEGHVCMEKEFSSY